MNDYRIKIIIWNPMNVYKLLILDMILETMQLYANYLYSIEFLISYNCVKTNDHYQIEIITLNQNIACKLIVLDRIFDII